MRFFGQNRSVGDYVNDADWYRYDIVTLCRKLGTDMDSGLSEEALKAKKASQDKNDLHVAEKKNKENARYNAFSALSLILIALLIVSAVVTGDKTALAGAVITLLGYAAVLVLFRISEKITSELSAYSLPEARVMRAGKLYRISQINIVQGDIVFLSEGDIAPCDGRIITASGLRVLEKNISGGDGYKDEDFYQRTNGLPTSEQKNMVFAGSAVAEGSCRMVACDTGGKTLTVRRGIKAFSSDKGTYDIFKRIAKISRTYSVICSALLFAVTVASYIKNGEGAVFNTFLLLLSVAASSFCELLCAIAQICISVGLLPESDPQSGYNTSAVIKNLTALKRLRGISCLMVPKSGGICENRIKAEKVYTNGRELDVSSDNRDKLRRTVYIAVSTLGGRENHVKRQTAQTEEQDGIIGLAEALDIGFDEIETSMIPIAYLPGDGERLFDTALVAYWQQYMICVRGPALQVVNRCTKRISNGAPVPLSADGVADLLSVADEYESMAYRVIALASKPSRYNNLDKVSHTQEELCFEGFLVMYEPFSPQCADTVASLGRLGVRTVMFSDDMTSQSRHLAKHLGICRDDSLVLSAPEFVSSNERIIDLKMMSYRLFMGLGNRQKKYVADSYLASGEHIGVIGQHLYDISLMNGEETVGFAANLTLSRKKRKNGALIKTAYANDGSEALRCAADVVITSADQNGNGGINAAYEAILKARRICNNVRNIMYYLAASNTARLVAAVLSVMANLAAPSAVQMIFSGVVTDLLAVIAFCFSDNKKLSEKRDLVKEYESNRVKTVFSAIVAGALSAAAAVAVATISGMTGIDAGSETFICFGSLTLLQLTGCLQLMAYDTRLKNGFNGAYVISALLVLEYFALSAVFKPFFDVYLTGSAYTKGAYMCVLPALAMTAVCAVVRFLRRRKN